MNNRNFPVSVTIQALSFLNVNKRILSHIKCSNKLYNFEHMFQVNIVQNMYLKKKSYFIFDCIEKIKIARVLEHISTCHIHVKSGKKKGKYRGSSTYTLRKLYFHFNSNWVGYDRGDSFPLYFEPNEIPFGSKAKGKPSPRSYPIHFERKCVHHIGRFGIEVWNYLGGDIIFVY